MDWSFSVLNSVTSIDLRNAYLIIEKIITVILEGIAIYLS